MLSRILTFLLVIVVAKAWGWQDNFRFTLNKCRKAIGIAGLSVLLPGIDMMNTLSTQSSLERPKFTKQSYIPRANAAEEEQINSLQAQLQVLRNNQLEAQRTMMETKEQELLSRELTYPEGRLVASGTVVLPSQENEKIYPYGLAKANELNSQFDDPKASLFILAVGRSGAIIAAQRLPLQSLPFPYTFEITSEDLIFPLNEASFARSEDIKDSIALTALVSKSDRLAEYTGTELSGFGLSENRVFAGKIVRSCPKVNIANKVDKNLYNVKEIVILTKVDEVLDSRIKTI